MCKIYILFISIFVTLSTYAASASADTPPSPKWAIFSSKDWQVLYRAMDDVTRDILHYTNVHMLWQWQGIKDNHDNCPEQQGARNIPLR